MKQREIKFRAWNDRERLMSDPFTIIRETVRWRSKDRPGETVLASYFPEYHLMQSTGLKDKNGRDIFEGDVIRVYSAEIVDTVPVEGEWKEIYKDVIGYVFFEDGEFCFTGHSAGPLPVKAFEIEIIGNIFEDAKVWQSVERMLEKC